MIAGLNTAVFDMLMLGVLNTTLGPVIVVVPLSTAPFVKFTFALPNKLTALLVPAARRLPAETCPPAPAPPTVNVPLLMITSAPAFSVPPG